MHVASTCIRMGLLRCLCACVFLLLPVQRRPSRVPKMLRRCEGPLALVTGVDSCFTYRFLDLVLCLSEKWSSGMCHETLQMVLTVACHWESMLCWTYVVRSCTAVVARMHQYVVVGRHGGSGLRQ